MVRRPDCQFVNSNTYRTPFSHDGITLLEVDINRIKYNLT